MRDYNKLKNIYSEFTNENYQYTNELNENIRSQVLEALRLNPSQAIARLAKILETEKQGNKLLYSAAFYKRLVDQHVEDIEFTGTPRNTEKFDTTPSRIIDYDYNVLIIDENPRVVCPIGRTDSIFMNMETLEDKLENEKRKCAIYDFSQKKRTFLEILRNPEDVITIKEEYQVLPSQDEDRYEQQEPDITFEEYTERKQVLDPDQEKEEFLTDEDFKSNQISHDLGIETEIGLQKIDTIYDLFKKYSDPKYKYNLNKNLTERQRKELNEILKLEPQKAFEECYEFLTNYQKGSQLIFTGALMHELIKKGYDAYIAHITVGQNIEEYTDGMLQYEELFPAFKVDDSKEFYIIMPLGDCTIKTIVRGFDESFLEDVEDIEEIENIEILDTLNSEDFIEEVNFFRKSSDIITEESSSNSNIKIAFNRFSPFDRTNKTLGDILRTKEIIIKSREENDLDK